MIDFEDFLRFFSGGEFDPEREREEGVSLDGAEGERESFNRNKIGKKK
jgi:hypothetical protein